MYNAYIHSCYVYNLFERNVQGVLIQITLWLSDILIIIIRYRSIFNISMKYVYTSVFCTPLCIQFGIISSRAPSSPSFPVIFI